MGKFIFSRAINSILSLFAVVFVAFLVIRLIPGDPVMQMLGIHATPQTISEVRADLGLDQSIPKQLYGFVSRAMHGDFGTSIIKRVPVSSIIETRLFASLKLVLFSILISLLLSLPLGIISAIWQNRFPDHLVRLGTMVTFAMPSFWLGLMLIMLFSLKLKIFPIGGYGGNFFENIYKLILPAVTIALYLAPQLTRALRSSLIETMHSGYIEATRARGFSEWSIVSRYAMKNSLVPLISILSINVGFLFSGTVVVESVFQVPGLGALLVQSVLTRDFPVIQGLVVVFGVLVILTNIISDIAIASIDPRVRSPRAA